MEILSHEYFENLSVFVAIGVSAFIAILVYWFIYVGTGSLAEGALISTVLGLTLCLALYYDNRCNCEVVEAKVSDWNVVYQEGWEVIDHKGNIATLQRELGKQ